MQSLKSRHYLPKKLGNISLIIHRDPAAYKEIPHRQAFLPDSGFNITGKQNPSN